jgi:hypothetical protein
MLQRGDCVRESGHEHLSRTSEQLPGRQAGLWRQHVLPGERDMRQRCVLSNRQQRHVLPARDACLRDHLLHGWILRNPQRQFAVLSERQTVREQHGLLSGRADV